MYLQSISTITLPLCVTLKPGFLQKVCHEAIVCKPLFISIKMPKILMIWECMYRWGCCPMLAHSKPIVFTNKTPSATCVSVSPGPQTRTGSPPLAAPLSTGWCCAYRRSQSHALQIWSRHYCCETAPLCGHSRTTMYFHKLINAVEYCRNNICALLTWLVW